MSRKQDKILPKKKDKYRIRNWREYNRSLVNRGSITFWFSKDVTDSWYSSKKSAKKGRPEMYSDDAIQRGRFGNTAIPNGELGGRCMWVFVQTQGK